MRFPLVKCSVIGVLNQPRVWIPFNKAKCFVLVLLRLFGATFLNLEVTILVMRELEFVTIRSPIVLPIAKVTILTLLAFLIILLRWSANGSVLELPRLDCSLVDCAPVSIVVSITSFEFVVAKECLLLPT